MRYLIVNVDFNCIAPSRRRCPRKGFGYRIPTLGVSTENGITTANIQLPGLIIGYTTDGTEPTVASAVYSNPLIAKGTLIFKAFDVKRKSGHATKVQMK
jgi:hexosaminidase